MGYLGMLSGMSSENVSAVSAAVFAAHSASSARAVRYHTTGKPAEVLTLDTIPLPALGANEVLVELETAVVHPSDLGMISGTYGRLRPLPAVAGREGVGRVIAVGSGGSGGSGDSGNFEVSRTSNGSGNSAGSSVSDVTSTAPSAAASSAAPSGSAGAGVSSLSLKPGDRVRMPEDAGVWREAVVANAATLRRVPADIPAEQAAMAFINPPTALLLLREFATLQSGDWVVQNAGNSAVGECVIQIAKARGLRSASLVRSPEKHAARLKALGADIVLADDKDALKALAAAPGFAAPKLALNSVGGPSAITLARALAADGVLVTFGGMTGDVVRFPTREFIFNNISFRGFWMDRWARTASPDALTAVFAEIYGLLRSGALRMAVDSVWPLDAYEKALERAAAYGRDGKVLLSGPASAAAANSPSPAPSPAAPSA
jgi:NADPH:quinone reductase-like Zn-dependent oxidoreductase